MSTDDKLAVTPEVKALRHAADQIKIMEPPSDPHTDPWLLGFCRARKMAADLVSGHATAYRNAEMEGDHAVGAGRLDHPLRHPLEAALSSQPQPTDKLAEAVAALEPFAKVADEYHDSEDDSFEVWMDAGPQRLIRASFRLEYYRRARTALANIKGSTND